MEQVSINLLNDTQSSIHTPSAWSISTTIRASSEISTSTRKYPFLSSSNRSFTTLSTFFFSIIFNVIIRNITFLTKDGRLLGALHHILAGAKVIHFFYLCKYFPNYFTFLIPFLWYLRRFLSFRHLFNYSVLTMMFMIS